MHWVDGAVLYREGELILLCKIECCVVFWLELYTNLALELLETEQPTNGNMWKMIEMFFYMYVFSATFTFRWIALYAVKTRALLLSNDQYSGWPRRKNRFLTLIIQSFKSVVMLVSHDMCFADCCRWCKQYCADT